jgi:hypothetical protein
VTLPDRWRRSWPAGLIGLAILAILAAGCGQPNSGTPGTSPAGTPGTSSTPAFASDLPAIQPTVIDPGLLAVLPANVDGVPIQAAPETAAGMVADPALTRSASAVAVGLVVAPGDSGSEDLAVATVLQLRPGVFSDAFFSQWRLDYDGAACAPAGGVASHAQEVIGSNTVQVTLCRQGARTYHVHLAGDVLVSVTAAGDRRFGERIVAGLRR